METISYEKKSVNGTFWFNFIYKNYKVEWILSTYIIKGLNISLET